jgi:tetratricopeptide (TPR) repeat protein
MKIDQVPQSEGNNQSVSDLSNNPREASLSWDSDYLKLIEYYQNAKFGKCMELLEEMELQYPDRSELVKVRSDLEVKLSLKSMESRNRREKSRERTKTTLNMSVFAILGTLLVLIAFFFSYNYLFSIDTVQREAEKEATLISLYEQAAQLLLVGKPEPAIEILNTIKAIDPNYETLPELTSQAEQLLVLEDKYQTAMQLVEEDDVEEALAIFRQIDAEMPGLWGVKQQISSIETSLQITQYLEDGSLAYQEENWDQVIASYEAALSLDPKLDDLLLKEQLFQGYLHKIINLLQVSDTTTADIELAEQYYRKAVALFPQSKEFASERENLQEVSGDLLEYKFTQTAKALLADKAQTSSTIAKAVSYLKKAANIQPNNSALLMDIENAEYYQIGFQNFIEMNWPQVILNLSKAVAVDSNYASGNAKVLLYEAYYALGKQYYAAGFYQDAISQLEQAEVLIWEDNNNLMRLFQVQVLLGDNFGKLGDYKNATSYYQYALNAIDAPGKLGNHPELVTLLNEVVYWVAVENYKTAFETLQEVLADKSIFYTSVEVEIEDGVCLAFFASENLSTIEAITEANNLTKTMVITFGRVITVPVIVE